MMRRIVVGLGVAGVACGLGIGWLDAHRLQLPRADLTPGAAIEAGACRPHTNVTERLRPDPETWRVLKLDRLRAYGIPAAASGAYELDHLIPVCLGGVAEVSNLWPQPWPDARRKDADEARVCRQVCSGRMKLEDGWAYFVRGDWAR